MKTTTSRMILGFVTLIVLAAPAWAQQRQRFQYDKSAEVTIKGTVEEVATRGEGERSRSVLMVKAGEETLNVPLGPSQFMAESKVTFTKGDQVEIIGVKREFRGGVMVMAREIKKGDQTLTLRDEQGNPKWGRPGQGGRRPPPGN